MVGLDTAITLLEKIFIETTSIGGSFWIIQGTVILLTLALLTRKVTDWKQLTFPVIIGWHTFGLRMPWIFMIGAGTMFVLDTLSMKTIERAIQSGKEIINSIGRDSPKLKLQRFKEDREIKSLRFDKQRINIQEELIKLRKQKGMTSEARQMEELADEATKQARRKYMEEEYKKKLKEGGKWKVKNPDGLVKYRFEE